MSWKWGYARVSTADQTTEQQVTALSSFGCDEIITETGSGAKRDRAALVDLLHRARKGDTIVVWKLDRLARNTEHLVKLSAEFQERGIELVSLTEKIDTTSAAGKLLFHMMAALAQFERDVIQERIMLGLARARAQGRVGGRKKTDQAKLDHALANIARGMSQGAAAKAAGISRSTLIRELNASKTQIEDEKIQEQLTQRKDTGNTRLNGTSAHY